MHAFNSSVSFHKTNRSVIVIIKGLFLDIWRFDLTKMMKCHILSERPHINDLEMHNVKDKRCARTNWADP